MAQPSTPHSGSLGTNMAVVYTLALILRPKPLPAPHPATPAHHPLFTLPPTHHSRFVYSPSVLSPPRTRRRPNQTLHPIRRRGDLLSPKSKKEYLLYHPPPFVSRGNFGTTPVCRAP